jgi:hypothetical protein
MWENVPFFLLTLRYQYDVLEEAVLNGKKMQKDANGVWTSPAKL